MKRILVIGQCTLHWGRMEFGNIGNYYIVEPLFRELHRVFPHAEIVTTMQMTKEFQERENIQVLPMDMYYAWHDKDLEIAQKEYEIAKKYNQTGIIKETTPFIDEVLKSDLVIDFSGDMWGENADLAGKNRFYTGLLKNRTVQFLNKKNVLFLASPGPFDSKMSDFAKEVYANFDLVTLREPISMELLKQWGFDTSKTVNCACQSVLFEKATDAEIKPYLTFTEKNIPIIGFTVCGWNMLEGPFNRNDFSDKEFENFIKIIEFCCKNLKAKVCLFSHSNGFNLPPDFRLIHGRDYALIKRIYDLIQNKDFKENVFLLDKIYLPKTIKGIISKLDMLISGRVHGAIAGLSSCVPTVIIDYGHEPKAHKLQGFAKLYNVENYIASPKSLDDMRKKIYNCYTNRKIIKSELEMQVEKVKLLSQSAAELLKEVMQ